MAGGFSDILGSLAPMAGGFLGNLFGGEKGGQLGQSIGNMAGNFFSPQQQQQQPQQQMQQPQQQQSLPQSNNFGSQLGQGFGGMIDRFLPQQFQGMGQKFGGQLGNMAGNFAQSRFGQNPMFQQASRMMPQMMQQAPQYLQGASNMLGQQQNPFLKGAGNAMGGLSHFMNSFNGGGAPSYAHGGMADSHMNHGGHPGHVGMQNGDYTGYANGGMPHTGGAASHMAIGGAMLGDQLMGPMGGLLGTLLPFARGGHVHSPLGAPDDQMIPGHGGADYWPMPHHEHGTPRYAMGGAHMARGGPLGAPQDQTVPGHGGMSHWPMPHEMHDEEDDVVHHYAQGGYAMGSAHTGGALSHMADGASVKNLSQLMGMVKELAPYVMQEVMPFLHGQQGVQQDSSMQQGAPQQRGPNHQGHM